MRAEVVHHAGEHLGRIILRQRHQAFAQRRAVIRIRQEGHDGVAPRVIHDGIQLAVDKIAAGNAVGALIRRVLPDLAEQQALRVDLTHPAAQAADKFIRQLVDDVKPEAIRSEAQPVGDDGVLILDNIMEIRLVQLLDARERADAPPGLVIVGIMVEAIPAAVRRIRVGRRAVAKHMLRVKIDAVAARVGEHPVENDAHAARVSLVAQGAEVLLRAEHGVRAAIVRRVIAVVRPRHEDRVQVENADAQLLQIRQLFANARKISAEKVVVPHLTVRIGAVLRQLIGAFVHPERLELIGQVAAPAAGEAVREDLIHHSARRKVRHRKIGRNDAELPLLPRLHIRITPLPEQAEAAAAALVDVEPVKMQPGLLPREFQTPELIAVLAARGEGKRQLGAHSVLAVLQHQADAGGADLRRDADLQNAALPRPERSERGLVLRLTAVKQDTHLSRDPRSRPRIP